MRLATTEESELLLKEAQRWCEATNGIFSSTSFTVKLAVAEFLANQQGLTLYHSRVTEE